jgi:hypothetical protein
VEEEEVRIVETKIQVRTTKLDVGIEPLVIVHVEIIKTIVEETYV